MVDKYIKLDLFDQNSKKWTFGQIIALLLCTLILLELTVGSFMEHLKKRVGTNGSDTDSHIDDDSKHKPSAGVGISAVYTT